MNRVVLMVVSKVIPICFGFALPTAAFRKRISHLFLDQSEIRPQPIVTCLLVAFSRCQSVVLFARVLIRQITLVLVLQH